MTNLPNLLVEMRAEFEKKFVRSDGLMDKYTWEGCDPDDLGPNSMTDAIRDFIETQMKRVSEETYRAIGDDCCSGGKCGANRGAYEKFTQP